jgi:UrcA family protein
MEKHMTRLFTVSATAAVFAAFAWTGAAYASSATGSQADTPSEVVQIHTSDLSTASGADALYDRIQTAAWHVCADMIEANSGPGAIQRLQCINTLVDAAVNDVHNARLTAIHQEKTGEAYAPVS